jgi:plasmid stabilization system protein ParE
VSERLYRFHPAAERELLAAGDRYDEQVSGLGDEFLDAIDRGIAQILDRPHAWQRYEVRFRWPVRRYVLDGFPFLIVYYVADDVIRIVAVAHAKQKPGYWKLRLGARS